MAIFHLEFTEKVKKLAAVPVIVKDSLSGVTSGCDVIEGTGEL